ncbi:MAG TPA: pentapeptide repeat-containing protein [Solirubrobacteraceae bacterium]|nr:pentapeptide repeat-containing protein [Solirubrobacteraceae bacterium]
MVVALALVVWILPPLLVQAPDAMSHAARLAAENDARDSLLKALGGLVLLGGLVYSAKTFRMGAQTLDLNHQAQLTQRFTNAVEQLGHESRDVHIGAIHALAAIARDEPTYVVPVTEILTAFVRENARAPEIPPDPDDCSSGNCHVTPPTDVQAAVSVLGRRFRLAPLEDPDRPVDGNAALLPPEAALDLNRVYLHGVEIYGLDFRLAQLRWADLRCAKAWSANLQHANLRDTKLEDADLGGARLDGADLGGAHLTRAKLGGARLDYGILGGASLEHAEHQELTVACATYSDDTVWPTPDYDPEPAGALMKDTDEKREAACAAGRIHERASLKTRLDAAR